MDQTPTHAYQFLQVKVELGWDMTPLIPGQGVIHHILVEVNTTAQLHSDAMKSR